MPSKIQVAQNLDNKYLKNARKANNAPRANREKIRNVIQIFRDNNNVTRKRNREGGHGSLPSLGVRTRREERQTG